jgi:hypothetical protein
MSEQDPDRPARQRPEPELSPDHFALMARLVLRASVAEDELAESTDSSPHTLAVRVQPLIDGGLVKASTHVTHGSEQVLYEATNEGRDAFFEQVAMLRKSITDAE